MRLTKQGFIFVLLSVVVLSSAFNTGKNLLYLIFLMLAGLSFISILYAIYALRGVEVERRSPANVFQNRPITIRLTVRNSKRLPVYGLKISLEQEEEIVYLEYLGGGETKEQEIEQAFRRRGLHKLRPVLLETDFPFGFFQVRRKAEAEKEVVVYPEYKPLQRMPAPVFSSVQSSGSAVRRKAGMGDNILYLREYHYGDEVRKIHWKSTARLGKLIVKEYEKEAEPSFVIMNDPASIGADPNNPDELFEKRIRMTAALCDYFLNKGHACSFRSVTGGSGDMLLLKDSKEFLFPELRRLALEMPAPGTDLQSEIKKTLPFLPSSAIFIILFSHISRQTLEFFRTLGNSDIRFMLLNVENDMKRGERMMNRIRNYGLNGHLIYDESDLEEISVFRERSI